MERPSRTFVESIPAEIWSEVFQSALKTPFIEASHNETHFRQNDVPISVSQVCSRFRQIATNSPRLWSTIVVDFLTLSDSDSNAFPALEWGKLWLERSKSAPLSVFMYNIKGSDLMDGDQLQKRRCFAMLLSHIFRWKHVAIRWADADSDFWSLTQVSASAPLLETVFLMPKVDETMTRKDVLPNVIWSDSPNLRGIDIQLGVVVEDEDEYYPPEEDDYSNWATSYGIPYAQLTHLHLSACPHEIISRQELLAIFECASNLVCCFVHWIAGPEPGLNQSPLTLNHLRHLYLEPAESTDTHYEIQASQLLDYITTPSLTSLTLVRQGSWAAEPFKNFIERSNCTLEELNLIDVSLKVPNIYECLKSTSPSLRRIHVGRLSSVDEEMYVGSLTSFNTTTGEYNLCPNLEQVSLAPYPVAFYGHPPPFSLIHQVIKSRIQPPGGGSKRLTTLLIPQTWSRQIPLDLRKLCEQPLGLRIGFNDNLLEKDALWRRFAYE